MPAPSWLTPAFTLVLLARNMSMARGPAEPQIAASSANRRFVNGRPLRDGVSCRLWKEVVMVDVIVERCAGLDVHRDTVVATVRVPGKGKSRRRRAQETRTFGTTIAQLEQLADWLASAE